MRRAMSGLVPLAMAGAALFIAVPTASAATPAAVHPAATCPAYSGGSCTGNISVTITYNPNGTITIHVVASGFKPGEQVNFSITVPSRNVGSFMADSTGGVHANILLPAGYKPGEHSVTGLGTESGVIASTSFTLTSTSGNVKPCTASISSAHTQGVVLAAAYLSASCKSAVPAVLPGSAGGNPSSGAGNAAAVAGTASASSSASQLPFTGFNAATVAASGAILVGAGGAVVLSTRRRRRNAWQ